MTRACLQAGHTLDSQDPKEPVALLKLRPVRRPLVDGQLLPQGEVLEGELAVAAEQELEESKQVEQEKDHRAGIVSGSEPTDQPLAGGCGFGEGQGPALGLAYCPGGVVCGTTRRQPEGHSRTWG